LRWHDYRLNPDHPPLLKKLVALPLLMEPIWPSEIGKSETAAVGTADWRTLPGSGAVLENAWMAASVEYAQQWIFGHAFLYGLRDETIARLRQEDPNVIGPYSVLGTARLSRPIFTTIRTGCCFARASWLSFWEFCLPCASIFGRALYLEFGRPRSRCCCSASIRT
jgi:hypothetical protein